MKKLVLIFKGFARQMSEDNISSYASSCAFFVFLSLVPTIILILSILPYTPIDFKFVLDFIGKELPAGTYDFAYKIIMEISGRSVGTLSLAAVTTLWSAGKGVNSLITGFNAIDRNRDRRNWVVLRLISCLYTLVFLASIILILLLVVYGNVARDVISSQFPEASLFLKRLVALKGLISLVLMIFIFVICYAVLPYKKHKMTEQIPGAIFSALSWTGFSYIFSLYINHFNAFSMYGSLTTIIILLVWLYICMYILLIGANLNRYFSPVIKVLEIKNLNSIRKNQKESLEED